ncbi:FkbM family methyltransferase [Planktothrix agardhii 1029]|jgi:FkbM family methyltransferase|uniref:FkbM family methyltransferase n=1 Tax=Planktothrix agardhii TaxID=1160 RepID=UPI001D0A47C9|nr:FkbM family methyltransferase [Planktothrix agardhii]MCB8759381.1 FkbM family methyltransferase [Planktothrix agardhii 1813]MCB8764876.1 FkbM family methyltransferase [Planktothrix agardhii 1809]MCF3566041.1 FkbM family methyltransferase [Planktothrix agardhii 1807]MCF3578858.1 FkbM family methyltransferase [Planktothrix agardhii 1812]MCF3589224.1 FkbM family methyltransferase [Planktothrix agardhii 1029]
MSDQSSSLNSIISPEIKNDEFYDYIQRIAQEENIKYILEIGSSSGEGSTEAFVKGIRNNPSRPNLFCMEVSQIRFEQLNKRYEQDKFVKCYNISSVSLEKFPDQTDVIEFYNQQQSGLNYYPLEQVLGWLQQDIEYIKSSQVETNGIAKIKQDYHIDYFDVVLIDGSEFTGVSELREVYGAKLILLDDINTFKNYNNYHQLLSDSEYTLVAQNCNLRNGYAIFRKKIFSFETEKSEQLLIKKIVNSGMTVFDVGANIGDYSILLSQLVGNSGKVYSFEPTSNTFQTLQNRLKENKCDNVYVYPKVIFSNNQPIEFNEFPDEYSVWNSIGSPQMLNPNKSTEYIPIVRTEILEAITLDSFCEENNIQSIDYLKIDVEGAESDVLLGATDLLRNQSIRFIQFEISQKMLEGLNRNAQTTFDLLIQNGYECHRIQMNGDMGEQVTGSNSFYENYIAFPQLPIHFFTIVLNGQPFIRYHIDVFNKLSCQWHWHIIEGVADLKHDTSWSLQLGGKLTDQFHDHGRSKDGTSEYLDQLAKQYPENITIYRKPKDIFWDGKREMVNTPLSNIQEGCLLWQIDVDELWTVEQIYTTRQMFITHPEKTAAFYWCWYFVGENLLISTRNCYAENPQQDWLRTWRFKPGMVWAAHEPPILVETLPDGQQQNVAAVNPFLHHETEQQGLIFQHFAYVMPQQLQFKEEYYGYQNALKLWQNLQSATQFPVFLREYFPWVQDQTQVNTTTACGITSIAYRDNNTKTWEFRQLETSLNLPVNHQPLPPKILIDGVFFQMYNTGIARVWRSLLEEWANNGFGRHIVILDRNGTTPKIPGLWYRTIPAYDYANTNADRQMLQQICDEEGAELFVSTYYTTPISTPSVFMAYDMIPEVLGGDLNEPMWQEKHHGIRHASAYIAISENTATDLVKHFPEIDLSVTVAHCGIASVFAPATAQEIHQFKTKYGINKPYFLLVGAGSNYKNAILFFQAFSQLQSKQGFDIVTTGSGYLLAEQYRAFTSGCVVHSVQLTDDELRLAYSGATALVYPSQYEGFGMPVAEALACGCPVITCPNASLPEVAGEAAIYINDDDVNGLANALCEVQKPEVRQKLIEVGLQQAKKFSWSNMANIVSQALLNATLLRLPLKTINFVIFPDWNQPEEILYPELADAIQEIASHPNRNQIALLIDHSNFPDEEADLALSSVIMNLLMEEDIDIDESLAIGLIGKLSPVQWSALYSRLQGRIILEHENQEILSKFTGEKLSSYSLVQVRDSSFKTEDVSS